MSSHYYLISFLVALLFSIILTILVRKIARHFQVVDWPQAAPERKIHQQPIPLLGGLAIFLSFFLVLIGLLLFSQIFPTKYIPLKYLVGLFLMIGGFLDDKYHLKPHQQIIWSILAVLAIGAVGIGIQVINNPLTGGLFHFNQYKFKVLAINKIPYYFTLWADLFTFIWLMGMIYTTKLLDGLDGLVSGLGVIGSLMIAGLCLLTKFYQPEVAILSLILAGACLGFLFFNFYPAKIFLGEGGSLWLGLMLGVLAIISGGKVATTLLIFGIPIFDVLWVILRRVFKEKKSPFLADKKHLHFRLLEVGLSQRQVVLLFWGLAAIFGLFALFLQTRGKVIALTWLLILMVILATLLTFRKRQFDKINQK